jgi:hypothetical protein
MCKALKKMVVPAKNVVPVIPISTTYPTFILLPLFVNAYPYKTLLLQLAGIAGIYVHD